MACDTTATRIRRGRAAAAALAALAALWMAGPAAARPSGPGPGYVDGEPFLGLVGDDDVSVEISLSGTLLRAISRVDSDLHEMASGLESIRAVILDLRSADVETRARELVKQTERQLTKRNWSRLAHVRDQGSDVKVLVLNDDEKILGLVVMAVEDRQLVFANIAGTLDLAAIREIGASMEIPGLDEIEAPRD